MAGRMKEVNVKDLVTLLIDSEGPVEQYPVLVDDHPFLYSVTKVTIDHERRALIVTIKEGEPT